MNKILDIISYDTLGHKHVQIFYKKKKIVDANEYGELHFTDRWHKNFSSDERIILKDAIKNELAELGIKVKEEDKE